LKEIPTIAPIHYFAPNHKFPALNIWIALQDIKKQGFVSLVLSEEPTSMEIMKQKEPST